MRPVHPPATDDIELTAVLYALADPVRLDLVRGLSTDRPASCVGACIDEALPRAIRSRRFDPRRSAGLWDTVKSGTQYLNTLRCDAVERRLPGPPIAILAGADGGRSNRGPARKAAQTAMKPASRRDVARGRRCASAPARAAKARA